MERLKKAWTWIKFVLVAIGIVLLGIGGLLIYRRFGGKDESVSEMIKKRKKELNDEIEKGRKWLDDNPPLEPLD